MWKRPSWLNTRVVRGLFAVVLVGTILTPERVSGQTPISIVVKRSLKFEDFATDIDAPGTVIIGSDGTKTVTGSVVDFGGNHRAGRFQVVGDSRAWVVITMPSSVIATKNSNSSFTMTMDTFTLSTSAVVRLNKSGKKTIDFGATMHVGVNQKKGNYSATIPINVEYQ